VARGEHISVFTQRYLLWRSVIWLETIAALFLKPMKRAHHRTEDDFSVGRRSQF
jgi:hypothetical protein